MSEIVYGRHPVHHLLTAGRRKARLLHIQKGSEKDLNELLSFAKTKNIPVQVDEPRIFSKPLKPGSHHQGVYVETEAYPYTSIETLVGSSFLLILDEIQDPQNLGALCRSAYLFGTLLSLAGGQVLKRGKSANKGKLTNEVQHVGVIILEYLPEG